MTFATTWAAISRLVDSPGEVRPESDIYWALGRALGYAPDELLTLTFEAITHPDDLEKDLAEVKRLEALGARALGPVKRWVVMEAPTGQRFCVVRRSSPGFDAHANEWR